MVSTLYWLDITKEKLIKLYHQPLNTMKNRLSYILLALTIFSLNALPVQASSKTTKDSQAKKQSVLTSNQWCFELPQMGLFCYEL